MFFLVFVRFFLGGQNFFLQIRKCLESLKYLSYEPNNLQNSIKQPQALSNEEMFEYIYVNKGLVMQLVS